MDYPVTIRRQRRRNLMMRVVPGAVEVYIPHWLRVDSREVRDFIRNGLEQLGDAVPPIPAEQTSTSEIQRMVADWSARMAVKPARVQMRDMRRKWGSCSSRSTITLNTRLCWLPQHLAEYVVAHELAHLVELNHSPAFWALLTEHMPDCRLREAELRAAEATLFTLT